MIPGIEAYMAEWTKHWDDEGILADAGMIPMPRSERDEMAARIKNLPILNVADLR